MDRRTLLRGLLAGTAVSIALPPLEAMMNINGTAFADGDAFPDRFGLWFWGNGVKPDRWVPSTQGSNWEPRSETEPLRDLRPWVSVVSGCEIKTATHPHHSGMTGVLTGAHYHQLGTTRDTIVSTFDKPSVDMVAAAHFEGHAPFRSIEAGVTRFRGTDEGTTFQHLSHNGPNNVNASEYDATNLYNRLFGTTPDITRDLARLSVLDAVRTQTHDLQRRLGHRDRIRMEQHLDSIRALELRLNSDTTACVQGDEPGNHPDVGGLEQIEQKNEVMSELLTLALACDLTRAFSLHFSTCGSGVVFWQVGATDSMHYMCHTEAGSQARVHQATVLTMEQLAVFLRKLRDTPEGDGSLLDHCSILCTTELADGQNHQNHDFPILIAGKGNGRLKGNQHYRSGTRQNTSRAVLTALQGGGVPVSEFGYGAGRATSAFGQLLV